MFRNRRWILFAIVGVVLLSIFSNVHDAREEQRAYQEGFMAGQMAALTAQGNNATGAVPQGINPYGGYNDGFGYRGRGGPGFFPGFLFLPLLVIGGFAIMRYMRRRAWKHAAWGHDGPDGQGFEGHGPWGGPDPRSFRGRGPWGRGGPGGFRGRPGSNVGSGYWWRDGDTPPNTPEHPAQPKPQPTEEAGGEDPTV